MAGVPRGARANTRALLRAGVKHPRAPRRDPALRRPRWWTACGPTVGSTNLDWRSFLHNHELNAVVLGAEFGRELQTLFDRDLAESDAITLEAWQQRGIDLRIKELFAQAWEYWL